MQTRWRNYQAGEITQEELTGWFRSKLVQSQSNAFLAGKRARGDFSPLTDNERAYLHGQYSKQMRYWYKFMRDYSTGKGVMPYRRRADLYAKSLYGLFQRALFNRANAHYEWLLGKAEHCSGCVHRAAASKARGGYTLAELEKMGFPGEGKTPCGNSCQCRLREIGGSLVDLGKRYLKPLSDIDNAVNRQVPPVPPAFAIEGDQIILTPNYEAFVKGFTQTLIKALPEPMKTSAAQALTQTLDRPLPKDWLGQIGDQLKRIAWPEDTLGALWLGWLFWAWLEQQKKKKDKQNG